MIAGLRFPYLSEADPEVGAEAGIDPLGLSQLADRLADEIAPGITARMSRIRYVTAMCAGAAVLERFEDRAARDGSPPFLVLEWILVDAFARKGADLPGDARQIPGIDKARAAHLRGEPMSAALYLKAPTVFGFHGVYRTLAVSLGLLDRDGILKERGERLARVWESERGLSGFVDRDTDSPGGRLRSRLEDALDRSLTAGHDVVTPHSSLNQELLEAFRPDGARPAEKRALRELLLDDVEPVRRELLLALDELAEDSTEWDALEIVEKRASQRLRDRIRSIQAFEDFSERLTRAFERFEYRSTQAGNSGVGSAEMGSDEDLASLSASLPQSARAAIAALERLETAEPAVLFRTNLSEFEQELSTGAFFDLLLQHHERTQRVRKPQGKRPWYEPNGARFVIRSPYRRPKPTELAGVFIHPFRVRAMLRFLADTR